MDTNDIDISYCSCHLYVDEYGNPIERTPLQYPYSFDGYVTFRGGKNEEINATVYSDRLLQQNYTKTRALMENILRILEIIMMAGHQSKLKLFYKSIMRIRI